MRAPYLILILLLALLAWAPSAHAARSYDNCSGVIASLPATISTPGTWCMKQDLATAITSGFAITIAADNVTVDCNDHQVNGLAAGVATHTTGIFANEQSNVTVRHCDVRGFETGIELYTPFDFTHGYLAEYNHLDGNTGLAMWVMGQGGVVRHNEVLDTGNSTIGNNVSGIWTDHSVDVIDNVVSGVVAATGSNGYAVGIWADVNGGNTKSSSARIEGNTVSGLHPDGTGRAFGIEATSYNIPSRMAIRDNRLVGDGTTTSVAFWCDSSRMRVRNNTMYGFGTAYNSCADAGGNDYKR